MVMKISRKHLLEQLIEKLVLAVFALILVFALAYLSSAFICGTLDIMAMGTDTKVLMIIISLGLIAALLSFLA